MSGAHRAGGDRHLRKVCFTQLFSKEFPDWFSGENFFTAFASAAVKTSREMALLGKQPISSAVLRCLSEPGKARRARQSPQSRLASNSWSFFPSGAPGGADAPRQRCCCCARSAGSGAGPASAASGGAALPTGWNSEISQNSFQNHSRAPPCPALPSPLRPGLGVTGFKARV